VSDYLSYEAELSAVRWDVETFNAESAELHECALALERRIVSLEDRLRRARSSASRVD
jgi:predicted RNase H-like nuclease (RuvC/YqgF family)